MPVESTPPSAGKEAGPAPPSPKPGHPRVVAALLIVATLLSVVGIFSAWINRQALNTDNWVNTSTKLLQNEDIQEQLAIYLSDQLIANVNLEEELQKALPPKLAPLAAPAAERNGLQGPRKVRLVALDLRAQRTQLVFAELNPRVLATTGREQA